MAQSSIGPVSPSLTSTRPSSIDTKQIVESQSSNIIYSHTGVLDKSDNRMNATKNIEHAFGAIRSYGADGGLLHKIGKYTIIFIVRIKMLTF